MLLKRQSIYYFRLRIPADVRQYFPVAEIVKSLHTRSYRQAKGLARGKLGELEKVFMTIRSGVLTDAMIQTVVTRHLDSWVSAFDKGRATDYSSFDHAANGGYETHEGWHKYLQNPEYTGHPIRFELDTESGSSWTLNPVLTGQ